VRTGARTPDAVLERVSKQILRQLTAPSLEPDRRAQLFEVGARLSTERQDARRYAQTVLAYEALPPEARARVKAARQAEHLDAWMATQPATEKQLGYLRMLGHRVSAPLSKRDASDLIDALVHQREDLL
jgi:hypothetical protein